ncbi:hypothetical protein G9A89_001374 [Geosiphon pyriformis]|nr:hypothetical protein G9A89_001374 [Geosiphon pyriformis]
MAVEGFLHSLSHDFSRLLSDADDHNVKIKVGEEPNTQIFWAHSVVLRARSKYFRAALSKDWGRFEGDKLILIKSNISPKIFQVALSFIYTGILLLDCLNEEEILELLIAADEMALGELLSHVECHLLNNRFKWLKNNFVLVHHTVFKHHNLTKLQEFCLQRISDDPNCLFSSEDFGSIDLKLLISLLERDNLLLEEIDIWKHVIKWGIAQNSSLPDDFSKWSADDFLTLKASLHDCIPLIRFEHIKPADFYLHLRPFQQIIPVEIFEDILRCKLMPGSIPKNGSLLPSRGELQSTIINVAHVSLISSWIDRREPLNYYTPVDSPYKFITLVRGTRDGFNPRTFRERCNDQGSTVVILKIHGTGQLIGGYNPIPWGCVDQGWISTKQSFLFSLGDGVNLANLTHSRVQKAECAIHENPYRGPKFGYSDFVMGLSGHAFNEPDSCLCQRRQYDKNIVEIEDLFHADEYEVFQVISKN